MTKFDPTKPVQTREGRKARIVCVDRKGYRQPISVLVEMRNGFAEELHQYSPDGSYWDCGKADRMDLINIPEPKKLRPFTLEEVPVGAVVQLIKNPKYRGIITEVNPQYVRTTIGGNTTLEGLRDEFALVTKTKDCLVLSPCGIEE